MKDISIYLSIIASLLFIGSFIVAIVIMLIGRTVRRYKQMVLIYTIGLVFGTLGHIFRFIYSPLPLVNTILLIVFDLFTILLLVQLWKIYGSYKYAEGKPVDEWVLAEVVEYGGVTKTQFVSEAVPLKKGSYTVTSGLSSAQVFVSARDSRKYRRTHEVPESYIPVPKAFFTN